MPMPTPTYEFMFAETCVLWDTQDYPLPPGLDLLDLQRSIEPALSEKGLHGEVSITPYLDVSVDEDPRVFNGAGCYYVRRDRYERLKTFAVHLLAMAARKRWPKQNVMLIVGDISGHVELLNAILQLKSKGNYNVLLTQPQSASVRLSDAEWFCTNLSAGEKLISQIEQLITQKPLTLSQVCRRFLGFGTFCILVSAFSLLPEGVIPW